MSKKQIMKLQERIAGVSILVNMVCQNLKQEELSGSGEVDDAIFALQAIDSLFTQLLDDCELISKEI